MSDSDRDYYLTHRVEVIQQHKEYIKKNAEHTRLNRSAHYFRNKSRLSKWMKDYYLKNAEEIKQRMRRNHNFEKIVVLRHYSKTIWPSCVRCGEVDVRCLTIDHVNGNGAKERHEGSRAGKRFYTKLRQADYPKGYQTLCMNCQFRKRWENHEHLMQVRH